MLDPASIAAAVSISTAAFNNIKKAFAVGRDIEGMTSDITRWMGASSDIDQAMKSTKNPPFYKKFFTGDTVEQAAVQTLVAKKTMEKQRYELQQYIAFSFGTKAWEDLLKIEGRIRKERQEQIYRREELKQKIIEGFFMICLAVTVVGFIFFIFWLKKQKDAA